MAVDSFGPQSQPNVGPPTGPPDICYRGQPWYEAYMSALFEADAKQVVEKIARAQRLMISREREVFRQEAASSERSALSKAFHALRALQFCHKL
jgi:hypothetical protein